MAFRNIVYILVLLNFHILTAEAAKKPIKTKADLSSPILKNISAKFETPQSVKQQRVRSSKIDCQIKTAINPDGSIRFVCLGGSPSSYSNSDIHSHSPSYLGGVGKTLTIQGQNMPALDIKIAGQTLSVISSTPSTLKLRLPSDELEGQLVAVRTSDNLEIVLQENYSVRYPFHFFESENTGFSWVNSFLLSTTSMSVYDDSADFDSNVTDRFAKLGLEVDFVDDTNPLGVDFVIAHNENIVLIAIRGTQYSEDLEDIAIDAAFAMIPAPLKWGVMGVHAGFYAAAASVFDLIADTVTPLLTGNRKLWITGHSLGGAMSSLIAYRLQAENNINIEGVQTFGSPRVGNYYWSLAYGLTGLADKTWRWAVVGDTVTTFPFRDLKDVLNPILTFGNTYAHVGYANILYADGHIEIEGSEPIYFQVDPNKIVSGLFVEHMSYNSRIYKALENEISEELYAIMPAAI